MASYLKTVTNGISLGAKHVVIAQDVTDTYVELDFQIDKELVYSILITDDSDVHVPLVDAVITFPSNGVIRITDGASTFDLTADYVIHIIANPINLND